MGLLIGGLLTGRTVEVVAGFRLEKRFILMDAAEGLQTAASTGLGSLAGGDFGAAIDKISGELLNAIPPVEELIEGEAVLDQAAAAGEIGQKSVFGSGHTADEGRILRHGIRAAIIGRPNVGKSSLLNQLLGHDRAIVSPIPGTTRDTIEETANIRGIPVNFIDTPGLREASDAIEVEGIRRSRGALANAEIILHVLDAAEPLTAADKTFLHEFAQKKRILIRNKIDLPIRLQLPPGDVAVDVCCLTGKGIEEIKDAIKEKVWAGEIQAGMWQVMINARHQDALQRARLALQRTVVALRDGLGLELAALDLRIAANAVGEIVDDLLDAIFSQFCIGK